MIFERVLLTLILASIGVVVALLFGLNVSFGRLADSFDRYTKEVLTSREFIGKQIQGMLLDRTKPNGEKRQA